MSDTIIFVENLSKRYFIGHNSAQRENYTALRDVIVRETRTFARKAVDMFRGRQVVQGDEIEEIWALRDVNFEVKRGEVLGIIGRNGAGKSTLLKVLSRITEPSEGRVRLRGRVGSLLEVGTGFHPELSGRENIYLNGAILGMTQAEIRRKFDEIVAFAEVEKFLDTPVKRYSSGMYVRLAFGVAAHLDPEILLVDEVLAVGDAEFQKKCLGKMENVARHGRTVIFVSHNLNAISRLCGRVALLNRGHVLSVGAAADVVREYLTIDGQEQTSVQFTDHDSSIKSDAVRITGATRHGAPVVTNGVAFDVSFSVCFLKRVKVSFFFYAHRELTSLCFVASDMHTPVMKMPANPKDVLEIIWRVPAYLLNPGLHRFGMSVCSTDGTTYFAHIDDVLPTTIHDDGVRRGAQYHMEWGGAVSPLLEVHAVNGARCDASAVHFSASVNSGFGDSD